MQAIDSAEFTASRWALLGRSVGPGGALAGVGLLCSVPFLWTGHPYPLMSFESEWVAASSLALALMSCGALARSEMSLRWPLPVLLIALTLLALLQQALGMLAYSQQATRFALYAAAMLAGYAFARQLIGTGRSQDLAGAMCTAFLVSGVFSVFVQWLQLLDVEVLPHWLVLVQDRPEFRQRPPGNIAQANHQVTFLALAIFSGLYLEKLLMRSRLLLPSLLALASGLALTGSRMGMAFTALALVALIARTAMRPPSVRTRWLGGAVLIAGYLAGVVASRLAVGEFDTLTRIGQDTLPIRYEMWKQALQISFQHPLLGIGVGGFPDGQYWVARAGPYTLPSNNCHNLVLQFAAEFGWPAALCVAAIGLWWGLSNLKERLSDRQRALAWFMMLAIAIHSMLEYPLWHLYFAIPASILFALGEPQAGASAPTDLRRVLAVAGVAALGVAAAYLLEGEAIAQAAQPLWWEWMHYRERTAEDAFKVKAIAESRLFRPEAERQLLELAHPGDENTGGPLQRSTRVVRQLAAPPLMAMHVVLLAKAGRIDEAIAHARRIRVFAGDRYGDFRDWILDKTRDLGPSVAPLRHELRRLGEG